MQPVFLRILVLFLLLHGLPSLLSWLCSHCSFVVQLRQYPCGFGYKLAELIPKLPEGVKGFRCPRAAWASAIRPVYLLTLIIVTLQARSPNEQLLAQAHGEAPEALLIQSMKSDVDLWEDADMPSVCKYLRGAAGLNVPMELREVLGMC